MRGKHGEEFQRLALQCWPIIRSPIKNVEDIHNEVMCHVHLIKNKRFARLAADNLINYVVIDFENHLIPVVSSLLSPMRDFENFKDHDLKITIEVLSQIMKRLIEHLEWLEKMGHYHIHHVLDPANGHMHVAHNHSDSDLLIEPEMVMPRGRDRAMTDFEDHDGVEPADPHTDDDDLIEEEATGHDLAAAREQSAEYEEFYRVKNALSLIEMWPHIRLLIEGYVHCLRIQRIVKLSHHFG